MEDEQQHFVGKIAQKAIIVMDGKVLVTKGIGDDIWEFPGGRLHVDEEPLAGLERELKEELGVIVKNLRPMHVGRSLHTRSNTWRVLITWTGELDSGTALAIDATEVQDVRWLSHDELAGLPMYDDCHEAVNEFLKR